MLLNEPDNDSLEDSDNKNLNESKAWTEGLSLVTQRKYRLMIYCFMLFFWVMTMIVYYGIYLKDQNGLSRSIIVLIDLTIIAVGLMLFGTLIIILFDITYNSITLFAGFIWIMSAFVLISACIQSYHIKCLNNNNYSNINDKFFCGCSIFGSNLLGFSIPILIASDIMFNFGERNVYLNINLQSTILFLCSLLWCMSFFYEYKAPYNGYSQPKILFYILKIGWMLLLFGTFFMSLSFISLKRHLFPSMLVPSVLKKICVISIISIFIGAGLTQIIWDGETINEFGNVYWGLHSQYSLLGLVVYLCYNVSVILNEYDFGELDVDNFEIEKFSVVSLGSAKNNHTIKSNNNYVEYGDGYTDLDGNNNDNNNDLMNVRNDDEIYSISMKRMNKKSMASEYSNSAVNNLLNNRTFRFGIYIISLYFWVLPDLFRNIILLYNHTNIDTSLDNNNNNNNNLLDSNNEYDILISKESTIVLITAYTLVLIGLIFIAVSELPVFGYSIFPNLKRILLTYKGIIATVFVIISILILVSIVLAYTNQCNNDTICGLATFSTYIFGCYLCVLISIDYYTSFANNCVNTRKIVYSLGILIPALMWTFVVFDNDIINNVNESDTNEYSNEFKDDINTVIRIAWVLITCTLGGIILIYLLKSKFGLFWIYPNTFDEQKTTFIRYILSFLVLCLLIGNSICILDDKFGNVFRSKNWIAILPYNSMWTFSVFSTIISYDILI